MKDMMCVATFAGMDSKPLVLEVRHFEPRENGELEIKAYWDMSERFLDIAHRGYNKLSIAWYNADKSPNTDKLNEVTYTSSTPFRITGGHGGRHYQLQTSQHLCHRRRILATSRASQS